MMRLTFGWSALFAGAALASVGCHGSDQESSDASPTTSPHATSPSSDGGGGGGANLGDDDTSSDASIFTLTDAGSSSDGATTTSACGSPPTPAGSAIVMAAPFSSTYRTFDLGPIPGAPAERLGGCSFSAADPNLLFIAVGSESADGAIYSVRVKREACGHIVGFDGTASLVATAPNVDANLIYGPSNVLFYSEWPVIKLSELLPDASAPSRTIDLAALGMAGGGAGGIGFVPPSISAAAGQLRAVTWPDGDWYHLDYAADGDLFAVPSLEQTAITLPNGPGGFAYVPQGSAQFSTQSVLMAEWSAGKVAAYQVDMNGDPVVASRVDFFSAFPKPWGAYFDPTSGDYLFLTWGGDPPDRIYAVEGFTLPPSAPTAPPPIR